MLAKSAFFFAADDPFLSPGRRLNTRTLNMDVNADTKPMDSTMPATSAAAKIDTKPMDSLAAEAAAAAMDKESTEEAAAVEPTANEDGYHPGAVKPNDSRLPSPAKKKALFASMGAKISDQKHTQEPPPPRRAYGVDAASVDAASVDAASVDAASVDAAS
eukprot:gene1584-1412_t